MANKEALRQLQARLAERLQAARTQPRGVSWLAVECAGRGLLLPLADAGEIFALAQTARVAHARPWFLGVANLFDVEFDASGTCLVAGHPIRTADGEVRGLRRIVIRPERVQLFDGVADGHTNTLPGLVRDQVYVGALSQLEIGLAVGDFTDVRMCEGVVADLVAFAIDALHSADVLFGLLADHEERALDVVLLEDVEDLWGPLGIGPVVEGKRDLLRLIAVERHRV